MGKLKDFYSTKFNDYDPDNWAGEDNNATRPKYYEGWDEEDVGMLEWLVPSLTKSEYRTWAKVTALLYRLRAGKKTECPLEDLRKAVHTEHMYHQLKHKCKPV